MARPLRIQPAGAIFHIFSRGNRRQAIFLDEHDRQKFLFFLFEAVRRYGWTLHSYCLMGNHYHLLLEIAEEGSLSPGMQWLNGVYAMYFNRRHKFDGHLFQGRFKSRQISSEEQLAQTDAYIRWNPVEAGLCQSPADWPWSSAHGLTAPSPALLRSHHHDPQQALLLYHHSLLGPNQRAGP